jgi:hypothetical protein
LNSPGHRLCEKVFSKALSHLGFSDDWLIKEHSSFFVFIAPLTHLSCSLPAFLWHCNYLDFKFLRSQLVHHLKRSVLCKKFNCSMW